MLSGSNGFQYSIVCQRKLKTIFLFFFLFLVFLIGGTPASAANTQKGDSTTLLQADRNLFSQNNITNWMPCNASNISGPCGGEITGSTWEERLVEVVEKYGSMLMNMQIEYGIPWEIPIIHAHAESHFGLADPSVAHTTELCGYYNWMGYKYGNSSLYGISADEMGSCRAWHSDGGFGSMYENLADMFMSFAADYLRNGAYDAAFEYAQPSNFDPRQFLLAETDGIYCTAGCGSYYLSVYDQDIDKIHEVAKSMGYPTSTELQKQKDIPKGGNWPVNGDIKNQINAEPHSLHADCSSMSTGRTSAGGGKTNGTYTGDGSDVTVIGDSISYGAQSIYNEKLPNADLYVQSSKPFWDPSGYDAQGGEDGLTILKKLKDEGKLRQNLVFALGSNNGNKSGRAVSEDKLNELLDLASSCEKIVILTNYYRDSDKEYNINNENFKKFAEANDKVILVDWKTEASQDPGKYMQDAVHPNAEGGQLFVDLIMQGLGTSSNTNKQDDPCCEKPDQATTISGGLTEAQAQKIADYYNADSTPLGSGYYQGTKENCVAFSGWFVANLTDLTGGNTDNPTRGDGLDTAGNLAADYHLETSDKPIAFSVFSNPGGTVVHGSDNHTGIVVGVEGDEVITIEAAWGGWRGKSDGLAYVWRYSMPESGILYADLNGHINTDKLSEILGESVSTSYNSNSDGVASSTVQWADGWITGGMEGYVKEPAVGSSYKLGDSAHNGDYSTVSPKDGSSGPNKITLHSTDGDAGDGNSGLALYGNDHGHGIFPAHFTINMKTKKVFQHLPITKPADAVASHDDAAGVQIEIIGFSDDHKDSDWYLLNSDNFSDDSWAYLGKLLAAISSETSIPLTTNVDWESPSRLSVNDFKNYKGILGHMHVPDNDHTDPGNIWNMVSKSLQGQNDDPCDNNTWTGDFPWYNQCDDRWANAEFGPPCPGGGNNVCEGGCGVASFAMMATALTGKEILPDEVGKYAGDRGGHVCGAGSSHSLPAIIADHFGLKHEDMGSPSMEEVSAKLKDGWMIWTCGNGGEPFTSGGHCIGIRGITGSGKWLVADSKGNGEDNTLNKEWDPSTIYPTMNTFQAIKRK
ncbi:hypothetical protein IKF89_00715 [Candidatus Saccharibacteria bacterium]|nr:hypothetical protein [Candidatus Saccharibacteria bacterium]